MQWFHNTLAVPALNAPPDIGYYLGWLLLVLQGC